MRYEAKIVRDILRAANNKSIFLPPGFTPLLKEVLDITDEEVHEIGDIIAADLRETFAFHPEYGSVNDAIKRIQARSKDE